MELDIMSSICLLLITVVYLSLYYRLNAIFALSDNSVLLR